RSGPWRPPGNLVLPYDLGTDVTGFRLQRIGQQDQDAPRRQRSREAGQREHDDTTRETKAQPQLSEHRQLVVQDDSERSHAPVTALGHVGVAKPELKPRNPGDVPDDVEIALADGRETGAGGCVDRIPPLGVAYEQRKSGDMDTRKQGSRAEIVPCSNAPRF